jgi:16S rRNA (cytosine1402-N4)-methyltransferase
MRMDTSGGQTAADVVNGYPESELARIIRDYGEERFATRIARTICEERERVPVTSTTQLADLVIRSIPAAARAKENQHPARRTFQAIRIEVNGELSAIEPSIRAAVERLRPGGRATVITFHSLEDRIVKQAFTYLNQECICDKRRVPVCICNKRKDVEIITKKPICGDAEDVENKRASSAKLRIIQRL